MILIRGRVESAVVALALGLIVVGIGALGAGQAAIATSIAGAVAFDVWHTRPYMSLKIDNTTDVVTTILLVLLGILTGQVTESNWRLSASERLRVDQLEHLHRIAELSIAAEDAAAVWPTLRETLCQELHLSACWFEPLPADGFVSTIEFAELTHNGSIAPHRSTLKWSPRGFELPRNGIELAITGGGRQLGRLVLLPKPGHAVSLVDRCFAIALADQFSLVALHDEGLTALS